MFSFTWCGRTDNSPEPTPPRCHNIFGTDSFKLEDHVSFEAEVVHTPESRKLGSIGEDYWFLSGKVERDGDKSNELGMIPSRSSPTLKPGPVIASGTNGSRSSILLEPTEFVTEGTSDAKFGLRPDEWKESTTTHCAPQGLHGSLITTIGRILALDALHGYTKVVVSCSHALYGLLPELRNHEFESVQTFSTLLALFSGISLSLRVKQHQWSHLVSPAATFALFRNTAASVESFNQPGDPQPPTGSDGTQTNIADIFVWIFSIVIILAGIYLAFCAYGSESFARFSKRNLPPLTGLTSFIFAAAFWICKWLQQPNGYQSYPYLILAVWLSTWLIFLAFQCKQGNRLWNVLALSITTSLAISFILAYRLSGLLNETTSITRGSWAKEVMVELPLFATMTLVLYAKLAKCGSLCLSFMNSILRLCCDSEEDNEWRSRS